VREPKAIFEEIQLILGRVSLEDAPDAAREYPEVTSRIDELRRLKVDEDILGLIDDSTQVVLRMKPGNIGTTIAYVLCEIDSWNRENQMWFGHLA
jgi:hypothetical protein